MVRPPPAEVLPCPTEASILAYVEGSPGEGRAEVEAHLDGCDECRRLVSLLAGGSAPSSGAVGPLFRAGDVILDKYEIVEEIGRGGMGVVVKALHRRLGRYVALKLLLGELSRDALAVARFFREARAVAALGGEHIVRVVDAERLPSGEPFLAFEHLEGRDLGAELRARGPLPIDEAVDHVLDACEALALAHRHGIVHRDIKPSNLFLTEGPDGAPLVKVLDFGIARMRRSVDSIDRTDGAALVGSPRYMPPEQLRSPAVDARADVWALAVSLFELIAGRTPWKGETLPEICTSITLDPPMSLGALRPDAPAALAAALERALRKDPEERTASVVDLAAAIAPYASSEGAARLARIQRIAAPPPPGTARARRPPAARSHRLRNAAVAAFGAAVVVAVWLGARGRADRVAAPPAPVSETVIAPAEVAPSVALPVVTSPTPPAPSATHRATADEPQRKPPAPASKPRAAESAASPPTSPLHRDGLVDRK